MLTHEDLNAIEQIIQKSIGGDISSLKSDVSTLKSDVSELKTEVSSLNSRVTNLEADMKVVKVDLLENNVIPRLNTIQKNSQDIEELKKKQA